ncbi:MAG: AmmeMemoRadiSam system protein B [Chitinispirillia bacterium]|nr:AmmeMemoRadiSam system protein B [Chitinispirillia bacterium]MCL2242492.1 AmmeMemoRadiSam system protein B [Chitinispirillia bacterium]
MPVNEKIRKPAVAGQFYPSSAKTLRDDVNKYLAAEKTNPPLQNANILIAPHAGYVFSAPVAAKAYTRIPRNTKTVFLIGPSHHKWFEGIHVTDAGYYETPLGKTAVNKEIIAKLSKHPLALTAQGAEEKEHCLEVHLPFLQVLLDNFTIVPIITGKVSAKAAAEMLMPLIDDKTAVIASSDLSHFLNQDQARSTDDATVSTILSGSAGGFMDGCGETAMRTVMHIAAEKGLAAELLDARTSFETAPQHGGPGRVVGYAAVAFVKKEANDGSADDFSPQEKEHMLKLARKTLENAVNGKSAGVPPPDFPKLTQYYGCFVTLKSFGQLRGCIGNIEPVRPLYKSVIENAVNAAFHDPRFPKVKASELGDIVVEVSVLTKPAQLKFTSPDDLLSKLIPFEHGVILKFGSRQSTFLPQVWEQLPHKLIFLEQLSMKAGMGKDEWKKADVWVYRAVHFSE